MGDGKDHGRQGHRELARLMTHGGELARESLTANRQGPAARPSARALGVPVGAGDQSQNDSPVHGVPAPPNAGLAAT